MSRMKNLLAATVPAIALLFSVSATSAQELGHEPAQSGDQQQRRQLQCGPEASVGQHLMKQFGMAATGETGGNKIWDMSMYANTEQGSWMVVGKNLDPKFPKNTACLLSGADQGYPKEVKASDWYKQLFTPAP